MGSAFLEFIYIDTHTQLVCIAREICHEKERERKGEKDRFCGSRSAIIKPENPDTLSATTTTVYIYIHIGEI